MSGCCPSPTTHFCAFQRHPTDRNVTGAAILSTGKLHPLLRCLPHHFQRPWALHEGGIWQLPIPAKLPELTPPILRKNDCTGEDYAHITNKDIRQAYRQIDSDLPQLSELHLNRKPLYKINMCKLP